jgi:uncharacterized membrane protein YhaH (DUF805 family)
VNWSQYLFSFQGRINRAKWWLFLLVIIGYVVAAIIVGMVLGMISADLAIIWGFIYLIGWLVLIYAMLAVAAKRLHDRNKSAWWLLVFYGIPFLLGIYAWWSVFSAMFGVGGMAAQGASQEQMMGSMMATMQQMWWVSLVNTIIGVWGLVELGILKGTTGPNQYGPDPLPATAT